MHHDANLLKLARAYAKAIKAAVVRSDYDFADLVSKGGFSLGTHGSVEFTSELRDAAQKLTKQATKVYGHKRIHERSVDEVARRAALKFGVDKSDADVAIAICDELQADVNTTHVVVRPNRVFAVRQDVDDIKIGPVRIGWRKNLSAEILGNFGHFDQLNIVPQKNGTADTNAEEAASEHVEMTIHLPELCWIVTVQGMRKQLDDTVRWMVDVTVSFIRLQYTEAIGLFPRLGDVESHPIDVTSRDIEGFNTTDKQLNTGGGTIPGFYEIDAEFAVKLASPELCKKLSNLLDPERNTVAERAQQMLGWLTRGRRTGDTAERVLFFFTAIEALLSSKSKSGPVTQTIARYAAVILSDDIERRANIAREIIALYAVRSRIVHEGDRSVALEEANKAHLLAWELSAIVLGNADLSASHDDFITELKVSSYGSPWPTRTKQLWVDPVV